LERKCKAVDAKELDWVHHHLREEKQDSGGKEGGGGFLRGMIDTVIGNLQLSITNVHIRYEVRRMQMHVCTVQPACM
jgi:Vacuolar sorting-associated protein 13, N-terminal